VRSRGGLGSTIGLNYQCTIAQQGESSRYRALSEDGLFAIIRELPQRLLLAGEKGIRLSLAGAIKKLPFFFDS
jgi:serine/threonine-protein kinase HipA